MAMRNVLRRCVTRQLRSILKIGATVTLAALTLGANTVSAIAAPFRPQSNDVVLLQLDQAAHQVANKVIARRAQAKQNPAIATEMAANYIRLGRSEHDERYFGYAAAILENWRDASTAPVELTVLRADIAQHQHRFDEAKTILDSALTRDERNIRAHLMRASVLMIVGNPSAAKGDCQKLFGMREIYLATVCLSQANSLLGQLPASYALLANILEQTDSREFQQRSDAEQLAWGYSVAAEMAQRLGKVAPAERYLRRAIELSPGDLVSRLQLCDLLLEARTASSVPALLAGIAASEPVLLRLALAGKQLGNEHDSLVALNNWRTAVQQSTTLGVQLHLREFAWGQLQLLDSPAAALNTAKRNWKVQREPIDARLLATAARTMNDQATLAMLAAWQRSLGLQDAGLVL